MSDTTPGRSDPAPDGSATAPALARLQAELVAALVLDGPPPAGTDPADVAATRVQLLDKRAMVVAQLWPDLAAALGPRWRDLFGAWVEGRAPAGHRREGYRFARHLARTRGLPPEAAAAVAQILLAWREGPTGLVPRRGPRWVRVGRRGFVALAWRGAHPV